MTRLFLSSLSLFSISVLSHLPRLAAATLSCPQVFKHSCLSLFHSVSLPLVVGLSSHITVSWSWRGCCNLQLPWQRPGWVGHAASSEAGCDLHALVWHTLSRSRFSQAGLFSPLIGPWCLCVCSSGDDIKTQLKTCQSSRCHITNHEKC